MTTSLITIEHQDETLRYTDIKEALVGFVKDATNTGLLFIKIETEEVVFSQEQLQEFDRVDRYPLLYTFNFANVELESQPVEVSSIEQLVGRTLEFDDGDNAVFYIRNHFEISGNKIIIEAAGEDYLLTWTGVIDDINYYDDRARPNPICIQTPVRLKTYESIDQYYELEYRSKV